MAFVSECLQPAITSVGNDDSTLIGDAYSSRELELARLTAARRAELEQERAINRRQYLHSMIEAITDDDSMSIMVDSDRVWRAQLARLRSLLAVLEQEREINRRQEHQSIVVSIGDYNAAMVLVDSDASRMLELEISSTLLADARHERLVAQRP